MTTEASLLGIPTFSCYPDKPFLILEYLIGKGLVTRETDPKKLVRGILATLAKIDTEKNKQTERAQRMVEKFEDPIETIIREAEKLA